MSEGANVEVVQAVVDAVNGEDIDGVIEHLDTDAELMLLRSQLEGGSYRGHDGARRMWSDLNDDWEGLRIEPEELREVDADTVAARIKLRARGRVSGVELAAIPIGWLIRLREGKIVHLESFSDPDEAFRAAGAE